MLIIREREYGEYNDERQGESQEFQSELLVVPKFYPGESDGRRFWACRTAIAEMITNFLVIAME
jgi:hypothetical protein